MQVVVGHGLVTTVRRSHAVPVMAITIPAVNVTLLATLACY